MPSSSLRPGATFPPARFSPYSSLSARHRATWLMYKTYPPLASGGGHFLYEHPLRPSAKKGVGVRGDPDYP